nr:mitotic apparatus protein p62-like [Nicotiana tomentosiformis]
MEEHVSEKIIVEEEKDSYNEALGVEDDENEKEEEVAEEEHVAAEEEITDEEDEEEDDEDDEQLEDGEDGLDSEIDAAVEGDRDALSIPVFVRAIDVSNYRFMTFLRKHSRSLAKISMSSKPSKEAMKKVMDDGQAFCDKVCQYSKKGVDAELLLKQLKSKRLYTVERFKITLEVHPYLISALHEMDMDYMKNLIAYDDEVADPIIDQLAVDLEWVADIKKKHLAQRA